MRGFAFGLAGIAAGYLVAGAVAPHLPGFRKRAIVALVGDWSVIANVGVANGAEGYELHLRGHHALVNGCTFDERINVRTPQHGQAWIQGNVVRTG